ncbi:hypothetical protein CEXT_664151 [Caerostris extrusa]|uniref:DSCAM/DSCAML C-terminal domain-containing protein n=1 Tax=Caerostris extrusa TaxID=172846 RepID=A0AAV4RMU4_CAEEX|nr:hypothetical protein CEXT_664151 [Caerostris extrusa]
MLGCCLMLIIPASLLEWWHCSNIDVKRCFDLIILYFVTKCSSFLNVGICPYYVAYAQCWHMAICVAVFTLCIHSSSPRQVNTTRHQFDLRGRPPFVLERWRLPHTLLRDPLQAEIAEGMDFAVVQHRPAQATVTLSDLNPGTWYDLLMAAHNDADSTEAEYVFATLTASGGKKHFMLMRCDTVIS